MVSMDIVNMETKYHQEKYYLHKICIHMISLCKLYVLLIALSKYQISGIFIMKSYYVRLWVYVYYIYGPNLSQFSSNWKIMKYAYVTVVSQLIRNNNEDEYRRTISYGALKLP